MPYTVTITQPEAKLLNEAAVEGVEGGIFTFEPSEAMNIISQVADATDPEAPGRERLADRLASLYGRYLADVRKRETAQAADAPDHTFTEPGFTHTYEVDPTNEDPVELPTEPEQVVTKRRPRRAR